jgi:GH24 family phage-related lysozyme (muramidase)
MIEHINSGDAAAAANDFLTWRATMGGAASRGVEARRQIESDMFSNGIYPEH